MIPFAVTIPKEERDDRLLEKLREEWPVLASPGGSKIAIGIPRSAILFARQPAVTILPFVVVSR
jgi:hypothetical protein